MTAAAAPAVRRPERAARERLGAGAPHVDEPRDDSACGVSAERAAPAGDPCRDIRPELIIELI